MPRDPRDKKRRRRRKPLEFKDFRQILDLPERLAEVLRRLLHVEKAPWMFAIDRMREHASEPAYRHEVRSKGKGKGVRHIHVPCDELKALQRAILQRFLSTVRVHHCRHGNQPGSSILTNAGAHRGAQHVFTVDLVNAFPTVFRSRITANLRGPLIYALREFAGTPFSEDDVEKVLGAIVDCLAYQDRLPQGPPSSPRVLDIVCMRLDQELTELLSASSTAFQSFTMTAYADDITISSTGEIPEAMREGVLKAISRNGFIAHTGKDKTKYFSPSTGTVPVVTGLVIEPGGRTTMAPGKVNSLRAALHQLLKKKDEPGGWSKEDVGRIQGYLGYVRQVYGNKPPSKLRVHVETLRMHLAQAVPSAPSAIEAPPEPPAPKRRARRKAPKDGAEEATGPLA